LLLVGLSVPAVVAATGPAVPALASLDRDIPALLEKWQLPGAAVALAFDGRVVFARGYGLATRN
jgi:CubicO group peptidase (beta-lactamase class C family)